MENGWSVRVAWSGVTTRTQTRAALTALAPLQDYSHCGLLRIDLQTSMTLRVDDDGRMTVLDGDV